MFKSLFFRRLFLPFFALICAAVLIIGLLGAMWLRQAYVEQRRLDLRSTLMLVCDDLRLSAGAESPAQTVARIGIALKCRVTLVADDATGTVLADSEATASQMRPHRFRPEIQEAAADGEGWDVRTSDTTHDEMLYHARRADIPGVGRGFVRLAVHMTQLRQGLRTFYVAIALAGLGCITGAGVISYVVARRQVIPVLEVTHLADAIANGQLGHRILRTDRGELGLLARSLNRMADTFARLLADAQGGQAELQTILAGMSEGVIAVDVRRRIVFANQAAGRMLGFNWAVARDRVLWEVLRNQEIITGLDHVAASGQRQQFNIGPIEGRHVEVTLCPLRRPAPEGVGAPASQPASDGCICVLHDITESLRYQQLRTEFVANVSHELRTPLSVIRGYIETLRDGAINDAQRRQTYLETVERHASQLGNLVEDLLQLSRLEHCASLPRRTSLNIGTLVQRVAEFMQPMVQQRRHSLRLELPPTAVFVTGNTDYLERAMSNLLDNAIKYTPEGGTITLRVASEGREAIIEVTDTGVGIAAEDLPRIFERFYRVDRSRSREMGGTGLGLSIVKHIAGAHGGTVEVQSQPGQGSTFRLRLPLGG